ncbi:Lrp/AsnC family transcriptional regulator [Candidatus Igneacidithiobacillus taiwanensis]|uniref:Lrp/AsnC family transcriptional regulator n=1 Tax=Candidatus Igneacidithiobacillus taiwanensis TaxID=1945924 RepID=UPI0028A22D2E|nr:Lrp/AsnC family transcriptional regulator [Candidatus Igneacidithiobacillus taiwanensis]
MDKLLEQDQNRLLQALQNNGPQTAQELSIALRLTVPRVTSLLYKMKDEHLIHSPRCTTGNKGTPINVWEILASKD